MKNTLKLRYVEIACSKEMISEIHATAILFPMVHTALPEDKHKCSKCGSSHVDIYEYKKKKVQACLDCGWEEIFLEK